MSNKGSAQKQPTTPNSSFKRVTNKELLTGKLEPTRDVKSLLKLDHLQKLATWAAGETSVPSLGAFYGQLFAATSEALAVEPDASLFPCQRCETILHPGLNCTVRIESRSKRRRRNKKSVALVQNNVVYKCHFCSHRNQKRGTPNNHMKGIYPPKIKLPKKKLSSKSGPSKSVIHRVDATAPRANTGNMSMENTLANPSVAGGTTLLDAKKRKRNRSGSRKDQTTESNSAGINVEGTAGSGKRKRNQKTTWKGLKDMFEKKDEQSNQKNPNPNVRRQMPHNKRFRAGGGQTNFLF